LTGHDLDRVETLLRARSAEMTRTRAQTHPSLSDVPIAQAPPTTPEPVLEVSLEGTCCDCGDRIPSARLKALPGAVRCVPCQRAFELGGV
jgi:Prokaryotic dksA/traR C4-type zinc finger